MNKTVITLALAAIVGTASAAPETLSALADVQHRAILDYQKSACKKDARIERQGKQSRDSRPVALDAVKGEPFSYGTSLKSCHNSDDEVLVVVIREGNRGLPVMHFFTYSGTGDAAVKIARRVWDDLAKAGCSVDWNGYGDNMHKLTCGAAVLETYAWHRTADGKTSVIPTGKLAAAAATVKDVLPNPLTLPEKLGQALKSWGL